MHGANQCKRFIVWCNSPIHTGIATLQHSCCCCAHLLDSRALSSELNSEVCLLDSSLSPRYVTWVGALTVALVEQLLAVATCLLFLLEGMLAGVPKRKD